MIKPEKRDYQDRALRKVEHFNGRALIALQMRLGKTFVALRWLKRHPKAGPAVVVCPEIGKWHWEKIAKRYYGIRSVVLSGETPHKRKFIHNNRLYILNWKILPYWVEFLQGADVTVPILDEVHYIKESTTLCYEAAYELASGLPYLLALGGTPLKSKPKELFNILNLLRPDKYDSIVKFQWRYCKPKHKPWGWEYNGSSHLDELHNDMNAWCMVRDLREDVTNDLPKERNVVTIPISCRSEYEEAEYNFINWLRGRSVIRATKAKKAERLVQMGYLKRLAASLKMPGVLKWIDDWLEENDGKLAVFAIHQNIIKELKVKYKDICVVVDGHVRGKKRQLAVKTFQRRKWCRLFIGQTKAAGTVIELSKAAIGVGLEFDWTPGDVTQWEDRIYEQNSGKALVIYYLVARHTVEHKLCEILQLRSGVLSEVLDGNKKKNPLRIFDMLERALLKGKENENYSTRKTNLNGSRATRSRRREANRRRDNVGSGTVH